MVNNLYIVLQNAKCAFWLKYETFVNISFCSLSMPKKRNSEISKIKTKAKKEEERKWKSRRAEKEGAVRKQNQDRSSRLQEDLRQMHSKRVAIDNNDGTRQDAQANLYNPVLESLLEEKKRADACEQRKRHGDIFLLLHLLDPLLIVDTAIRKLETFYLYAGFDCTHRWSNFLGDVSRSYLYGCQYRLAIAIT